MSKKPLLNVYDNVLEGHVAELIDLQMKDVYWQYDYHSHLKLVNGKLELIAKFYNAAFLNAELDITARELKEIEPKRRLFTFDLDLDGKEDELSCYYWWRWGVVSCAVTSTKLGKVSIPKCSRIGILSSITNGMHDLVCDRSYIFSWSPDNKEYVQD